MSFHVKLVKGSTPKKLSQDIVDFCRTIVPSEKLEWVLVIPEPTAIANYCHLNVAEKVKTFGGNIIYGWNIWYAKGVHIDAEFHSVWENEDGELIDITPKRDGETKILFLRDPSRAYEGVEIPNRKKLLRTTGVLGFRKGA